MSHIIMAIAALVAITCVSYLLLNPMERDNFFLTHYLGKTMFPKLARDQRQKRMSFIAGTILAIIVLVAFLMYLFKHLGKLG